MQTVVLQQPGQFTVTDTPEPVGPGPDEALVGVRTIGVCGTDYHAYRGRQPYFQYPRILGHELGVEVLEVGSRVTTVRPGDLCAVEPYLNCGHCLACRRNRPNCCESLRVLGVHVDGGMRPRIVVPANKLHRSERLTLPQLALVETLGIGAHAVSRADLTAGDTVLVVGAGPIGLSVVQDAQLTGARILVLDSNPTRLRFCEQHFDVHAAVVPGDEPVIAVREALDGELPLTVFDATGSPAAMQRSFQLVAHGGKLVFVGLVQADITFSDPEFHRREITLLASRNSTPADFRRLLGLLESGQIDTQFWISHQARMAEFPARIESWLLPETGVIKAVLQV